LRRVGAADHLQALEFDLRAAAGARRDGVQLGSAVVPEDSGRLAVATPRVAPLLECEEHWREIPAGVGEHVLVARWALTVLPAPDDTCLHEGAQAARKQAAWCRDLRYDVHEPSIAVEELAHDRQCVTVAEDRAGIGDRAFSWGWFGIWTHPVRVHHGVSPDSEPTMQERQPMSDQILTTRRVLTDGGYVVNHSVAIQDGQPVAVRFDLFRTDGNVVVDHWTDEEPWQDETANGHTQIDGRSVINLAADTEETRRIATGAVQTILVDADYSDIPAHLAGEDYVQHNHRFADGVSGLVAAVTALAEQGITMKYDGIRQVVAQGDFAYLRSDGTFAGQPFVFHDLFRVADGRCVEHWDVMVPAGAAS
jgi:predicted SnoaL-like aldol condensation-catalyzing enzyme